jgi:putative DNA primase/helicase
MKLRPFPLTEAGDAEHFASAFGDRVRFDHRRGRWLVFMMHRWVPDADGELHRLGLMAMRLRQKQSLAIKGQEERKKHFGWAIGGESRKRMENMLEIAKSIKPISDRGDNWDSDPWLLGVENGVLHLRTAKLRPGRPEDRITMSARAPYDPTATCPLWEQTVTEIFDNDHELFDYVQRALGYSLTGITKEQYLFMNWGEGANGKGTLINTVAWVLGDYADDLPFSALELQQRANIPNDVAKLVGKRFVTSSETSDDIRLNEARIKALTGCDPITARFLHREFFTFQPAAKFWLATNHKPVVHDDSHGFWRRMRLIPFRQQFKKETDDKDLKQKLKAEAPGILRWLVEGCLAWQARGLEPPQVVQQATREYEAESDPLTEFFDDCCAIGQQYKIGAQQLYQGYRAWYEKRSAEAMNQKRFGQSIRQKFRFKERSHCVTYFGIALNESRRRGNADP